MAALGFKRSSNLPVGVEDFLSTLTMSGVNAELRPLVKMTTPKDWANRPILDWPVNEHLFNSWILLIGILPIDRHSIYFRSITPGKGFAEASWSAANKYWLHERSVVPTQTGCRVTDIVEYESRLPLVGHLLKPVYELVFQHRHQYLRSNYIGQADEDQIR